MLDGRNGNVLSPLTMPPAHLDWKSCNSGIPHTNADLPHVYLTHRPAVPCNLQCTPVNAHLCCATSPQLLPLAFALRASGPAAFGADAPAAVCRQRRWTDSVGLQGGFIRFLKLRGWCSKAHLDSAAMWEQVGARQ